MTILHALFVRQTNGIRLMFACTHSISCAMRLQRTHWGWARLSIVWHEYTNTDTSFPHCVTNCVLISCFHSCLHWAHSYFCWRPPKLTSFSRRLSVTASRHLHSPGMQRAHTNTHWHTHARHPHNIVDVVRELMAFNFVSNDGERRMK